MTTHTQQHREMDKFAAQTAMNYNYTSTSVFLAEDDGDDRYLFQSAFSEVASLPDLIMATDGNDLMQLLTQLVPPPPKVIFLDLHMPRKSGFECLAEIRACDGYKDIPVVIFSTSTEAQHIDRAFQSGANYYFCKLNSFDGLKSAIQKVLDSNWQEESVPGTRETFVLAC